MNLSAELQRGLEILNLELSVDQSNRMLVYLELLQKWNQRFNLTAITEPRKMLSHHIFDSLSIASSVNPHDRSLDVGSGAGLPGIPLAIAMPESQWLLLDSNGKKTRFMQQAIAACSIENAEVVKSRVQDYHAAQPLSLIVSRAYASLGDFITSVSHLINERTRLLAMKTAIKSEERDTADISQFNITETELNVPGVDSSRTLFELRLNHD
ncbi:MAG: 16S rRNA (guanine527-N7)-methyltransferase [Gammaproteobacteria bacterium]